jgi:ATP-dependent Clp protease ATP-binding subunit ClpA
MEPIPRPVDVTPSAAGVSSLAQQEAERLRHPYLGPEHLLVGLLLEGDNLAARVLVAHGLELEVVRAEVDRLISQGLLPGPQPSDAQLLATVGVDLEAVSGRLKEAFGSKAYFGAAERVRHRPTQAVTHRAVGGPPLLICAHALEIAAHEAIARDQDVGPEHLLLGLLGDAEEPVEHNLTAEERRERVLLGLPDHGPHPIKLLVAARGLTLEALRAAMRSQLDHS